MRFQWQNLREIEETWQNLRFTLYDYEKGGKTQCQLLGSVDEIVQILDDNSMTLQSMSSSRFVIPFLPIVQWWEKQLTLIGEVLELWLVVQRKWRYLEGIFIGGDIRFQLPEEANKFDIIDKQFKKVCVGGLINFFSFRTWCFKNVNCSLPLVSSWQKALYQKWAELTTSFGLHSPSKIVIMDSYWHGIKTSLGGVYTFRSSASSMMCT